MRSEELLKLVCEALDDARGRDIETLDVRPLTSVTDHMVIASGTSARHVRALVEHVVEAARAGGVRPMGIEGEEGAEWVLVDLGDVVVHVMSPESRRFYDLEGLWSESLAEQLEAGRERRATTTE